MAEKFTRAGERERAVLLQRISDRFHQFLETAGSSHSANEQLDEVRDWARATQEKVEAAALSWFKSEIEGKRVPEHLQVPKPRQDRVYKKFGVDFSSRSCAVCGDRRVLNIAHIIPRAANGPDEEWNLMRLCANHHYLFDNSKLTRQEWDSIAWGELDSRARDYVNENQYVAHLSYWRDSSDGSSDA